MQTEIIQELDLEKAVFFLKRGEPVVMPTETVYGLAAPIFNEAAVRKIFEIKGRPSDNPLIAHIAQLDQARLLGENLSGDFYKLAERFWPGPLTLVVQKRPEIPAMVSAGLTIAIRMPGHRIARELIERVGEPLVAPSANLSGRPSPTKVSDVLEDLGGRVCCILEGGECEVGIESTVLSLFSSTPTLLRPGKIGLEELEAVLGKKVALATADTPVHSPGMKYRHYAPKAAVKLVFRVEDLRGSYILSPEKIPGRKSRLFSRKNFYAELREADRMGAKEIEIYCSDILLSDAALMNRLLRASNQK